MTEYEEICADKSIKELRAEYRYQIKELGYSETDSFPQYISDLIKSKRVNGDIDEYDIKFKCIDDWNRPIYKVQHLSVYLVDVNHLFDWSATKEEVDEYFKDHLNDLVIFGSSIDCDPLGTKLKANIKLNII